MDNNGADSWKEAFVRAVASTAVSVLALAIAIPSLLYVIHFPGHQREVPVSSYRFYWCHFCLCVPF
jgi:hypothetical protein